MNKQSREGWKEIKRRKKFKPVSLSKCPWHESKSGTLSYMGFFEDAEKRAGRGQEQKQCPVCGYWFWLDQFGIDPITKLQNT